jgi:O-antigen/teichoic acid export membrane protein
MLIINMANILGYEAIKWVVGVEMSVQDIGGYALIATIGVFIGTLVRSIAFVLVPAASQINALGEHAKNSYLALVSTKSAMIIASGLCIAPLFLYKNILVLWVVHTYQESYLNTMAQAVVIMLIAQTFICAAVCLLQMMTGIGKILVPGCVTMSWAVLGLSTVWAYTHWQKKSLVDVVVIISAARIIGSLVHLCYGLWVFKLSTQFVKDAIFRPVMAGLICMFLAIGLKYSIEIRSVYSFSQVALILVVS